MDWLKYSYRIESTFSPPIEYHAVKLRAIPMENDFQHIVQQHIKVTPECMLMQGTDGFGNSIQYGHISLQHDSICIESEGVVKCDEYVLQEPVPNDLYLYPTHLTECNEEIRQLGVGRSAEDIMHAVHAHMQYGRFVTDNNTTAIEAYGKQTGVCQDYAHLMIAACRASRIHARYVNGLMVGEGETHAWVEAYHDGKWLGYDPTHDRVIESGYLKFAHGRDVNDCPSNRGRFYKWTLEHMSVNACLT